MSTEPLLRLGGITNSFGAVEVLHGIDLDVERGEVVCIIGPSGSGKSTLLRCVNFIAPPTSGTVVFDGVEYPPPTEHHWVPLLGRGEQRRLTRLRAEIGMVFQHFNVFPHLTAEKNLTLGLRHTCGMGRGEATAGFRTVAAANGGDGHRLGAVSLKHAPAPGETGGVEARIERPTGVRRMNNPSSGLSPRATRR